MRISTAYKQKERSLEECLALIESGDIIAVSGVTTEPVTAYFVSDMPFFTIPWSVPTEMDRKIGRYVAELRGRTIRERVDALISISHPNFRAQLRQEAKAYGIIV